MKIVAALLLLFPSALWSSPPADECRRLYDAAEYQQAFTFCRQAAEAGDSQSQSILGECYDRGLGAQADATLAADWWRKAAEAGNLEAQNLLALKYYYGGSVFGPEDGWRQDYPEAMRLWRISSQQGNGASQFMLAEMYHLGLGVARDPVEAYAWYLLSAQAGYRLATDGAMLLGRELPQARKQAARARFESYSERFSR